MIVIGDFRHSIEVLSNTTIKDEYGAVSTVWGHYMNIRCSRKFISGEKTVDNKEVFNSQRVVFTTFYRNINDTMQIIFQCKKYLISSVVEIGYREGLHITAELIND